MENSYYFLIRISGYGKCNHKVSFGSFSDIGYFKVDEEILNDFYDVEFAFDKKGNIKTCCIDTLYNCMFWEVGRFINFVRCKYSEKFSYKFECYCRIYRFNEVNSLNYFLPVTFKCSYNDMFGDYFIKNIVCS